MHRINRRSRRSLDFLEEPDLIWGMNNNLPIIEKHYIYKGLIIPNRMVQNKQVHEITYLHPLFHIHGFLCMVENNKIQNIILFGYHPNRDPDTNIYCLPDQKKNQEYNPENIELLIGNIKTFYLDNCFYQPGPKQAEYKLLKSMYIQLNGGE